MDDIPKQIWYIEENDGLKHLLELNFKNRLKNVECKLDELLLFDLKLKDYETVYPLRVGNQKYILYLRKVPVGGYECELKNEKEKSLPYLTDRPKNFGRPRKRWDKIALLIGYLIVFSWILLILIMTWKLLFPRE